MNKEKQMEEVEIEIPMDVYQNMDSDNQVSFILLAVIFSFPITFYKYLRVSQKRLCISNEPTWQKSTNFEMDEEKALSTFFETPLIA